MEWANATKESLRIVDLMDFMRNHYEKDYKPNTRETIRKDTIHQFRDAGIIESNSEDQETATNCPKYSYIITDEVLNLIKTYQTPIWVANLKVFTDAHGTLIDKYANKRTITRIPIEIDGAKYSFSAGDHNKLQKAIIEEFASRFAVGSKVLYVGDTESKYIVKDESIMARLGIYFNDHDKLPDVILYKEDTDWIYFIESVTSVGPISPKRLIELNEMSSNSKSGKVFITAFLDRNTFKKFIGDIAWETEIWISSEPEHLIHFNGDRFFGPR